MTAGVVLQVGIHYEGAVLIHGMVSHPHPILTSSSPNSHLTSSCQVTDPESTFPPALMEKFAPYGTIICSSDGYRMVIQRFGGGPGDNRTSMNYTVAREDGEDGVFAELGIEKPTGREDGIMTGERLERVKEWIKADMAGAFDPLYAEAIDCLERVTVRGQRGAR